MNQPTTINTLPEDAQLEIYNNGEPCFWGDATGILTIFYNLTNQNNIADWDLYAKMMIADWEVQPGSIDVRYNGDTLLFGQFAPVP